MRLSTIFSLLKFGIPSVDTPKQEFFFSFLRRTQTRNLRGTNSSSKFSVNIIKLLSPPYTPLLYLWTISSVFCLSCPLLFRFKISFDRSLSQFCIRCQIYLLVCEQWYIIVIYSISGNNIISFIIIKLYVWATSSIPYNKVDCVLPSML